MGQDAMPDVDVGEIAPIHKLETEGYINLV
jgi:hypothetical protein